MILAELVVFNPRRHFTVVDLIRTTRAYIN